MNGDAFHFGGDLLGILLALVEHGALRAFGGHGARGGGAETGATAGDENGNVFQLHDKNLSLGVSSSFELLETEQSSSGCRANLLRVGSQHATADQRFHMPDVLATNFV